MRRLRSLAPTGVITPNGARIVLAAQLLLPSRFYLIDIRDGVAHGARQVWKKDLEIGVVFESTHSFSEKRDYTFDRLKQLWLAKAAW
jgi:hypothetical protein